MHSYILSFYSDLILTLCAQLNGFTSNESLTRWLDRLLRHYRWNLAMRYISTIYVYHLPRLRSRNVNRPNKRKWFLIKKTRSRQYHAETINDANYVNLTLLATTAESLLQTVGIIGFYVKVNKIIGFYVKVNKTKKEPYPL